MRLVALAILFTTALPALADEPPVTGPSLHPDVALRAGTRIVRSLSWTPDGKRLATGSSDSTLRLFELPAPDPVRRLVLPRCGCGP